MCGILTEVLAIICVKIKNMFLGLEKSVVSNVDTVGQMNSTIVSQGEYNEKTPTASLG